MGELGLTYWQYGEFCVTLYMNPGLRNIYNRLLFMKKIILSALILVAAASARATAPEFSYFVSQTPMAITQDIPSYANPACASADNNRFFIAGQFDEPFVFSVKKGTETINYDLEPGIATSSYILAYGVSLQPLFAFTIAGDAEITAMTTDDKNLYVSGVFAGKVTFKSASNAGKAEEAEGLKIDETAVKHKSASFIAVYDLNGELQCVKTFVPSSLPALAKTDPSGDRLLFHISDIQIYNGKLYLSANYTGETKIGDVTLDGSYLDSSVGGHDIANSSVMSLDSETLSTANVEMSVTAKDPEIGDDKYAKAGAITFNISKAGLYGAFITSGTGELTVKNGSLYETVTLTDANIEYYVVASGAKLTWLEKKASDNVVNHNVISDVLVENGKVYMVGSADVEIPSAKAGEGGTVNGANDIFVATFSAKDLSPDTVIGNANDDGFTEIKNSDNTFESKPNYEVPTGAITTNDYLMLVSNTLDFNGGYVSSATSLFTGSTFEAAKTTGAYSKEIAGATGIARSNGAGENPLYNSATIILPYSDGTEFKMQYTVFNQDLIPSGINEIAPDNLDENVPTEYYNLQGIRIADPAEGQIVIRRQGAKAEKIIL